MTDTYVKGVIGIEFAGQIIDADNPYNAVPISLENYEEVWVTFLPPGGMAFDKPAQVRSEDDLASGEILYHNTGESILTQRGDWHYTVGVRYADGSVIISPQWRLFWVI